MQRVGEVNSHEHPLMGFHMQLGPGVKGNQEFSGVSASLCSTLTNLPKSLILFIPT